jgi:hypothetical protein
MLYKTNFSTWLTNSLSWSLITMSIHPYCSIILNKSSEAHHTLWNGLCFWPFRDVVSHSGNVAVSLFVGPDWPNQILTRIVTLRFTRILTLTRLLKAYMHAYTIFFFWWMWTSRRVMNVEMRGTYTQNIHTHLLVHMRQKTKIPTKIAA